MKNADMPAMPVMDCNGQPMTAKHCLLDGVAATGMTKREMMAMHMMAAILVGTESPNTVWCASIATNAADQLIFELDRTKGESK